MNCINGNAVFAMRLETPPPPPPTESSILLLILLFLSLSSISDTIEFHSQRIEQEAPPPFSTTALLSLLVPERRSSSFSNCISDTDDCDISTRWNLFRKELEWISMKNDDSYKGSTRGRHETLQLCIHRHGI